jgi:Flp pilus assembly pilin Flp
MFEIVNRVLAWYNSFNRDRGASAVEYALILVAIAAAIAAVVGVLGGTVLGMFQRSCANIKGAGC